MARRRRGPSMGPLTFWADVALSGVAAAVTLTVRLPQLAAGTMSASETQRMVGEKITATRQGLAGGAVAAKRIARVRLAKPAPHRAVLDLLDIAEAASRPARRRVKANAKRLTGAKRSVP